MNTAIINMADQGPTESLIIMLRAIGWNCTYPSAALRDSLRRAGCDTVLEIRNLVDNWGYEPPIRLPESTEKMLVEGSCVLVDVKAHRNYSKIVAKWPAMRDQVLWMRINGGQPEHVKLSTGFDCGDETNPPCPIITPNQWYKEGGLWTGKEYVMWPPFYRFDEYFDKNGRETMMQYDSKELANSRGYVNYHTYKDIYWKPPVCLIHNLAGWGYGMMERHMKELAIMLYGRGSPDGLANHSRIPEMLSRALAMVHLKSSDAPGYALYEAIAAKCPIICSRRLIWRNNMQELLIPNETCLVFDKETHDPLDESSARFLAKEIKDNLKILSNPKENIAFGERAYFRLKDIMWSEENPKDKESLYTFMKRHFDK